MALTYRELQYLCFVCFIVTSECLSITYSGTFEINTEVNFTCVHDSNTGSHIWKVDTAEVLICFSSICSANLSNPTRFSFVSDPGNGVFVFTINPVSRLDDNSVIGCHDGSVEVTYKLEVKDPADSQRITSDGLSKGATAGIIVAAIVGAIFVVALVICCCAYILASPKKFTLHENEKNDEEPYVSWIPGYCGKCHGTFILKVEKKQDILASPKKFTLHENEKNDEQDNDNDTKNTTASELKQIVLDSEQSQTLDVNRHKQFKIDANNVNGGILMQIKGIEPFLLYRLTLCAQIMCCQSRANNLTLGLNKPDPPMEFMFNENICSDELSYVSWVQGFNGGCLQTFILKFEKNLQLPKTEIKTPNQTNTRRGKSMIFKENFHDQENTNITAAELNRPKIVEGHSEILDVKSDKKFAIPPDNVTQIIHMQVKGLEPSSQYEIKLYGGNKYGESEVRTLHVNTHDKPKSPKEFQFNENISSDELSFVSWVPGCNGGCYQKFILHFKKQLPETEIKTFNQTDREEENTNTRDAEPKPVQSHSEILDVESNKKFAIQSHNVTTIIRMKIKGLEPLSQYEITVCGKNKYGESKVKTLHEKMHDKPSPPEKFKFNRSDTFANVSWVPGYNGGCYQTFILQFEKQPPETEIKTLNQEEENIHHQEITNTTAAELNKPKTVEGHSEKLDVESYNIFVIPSHNVTTTICMQIKGLEPSSQYEIKLFGKNKYGESKVKTLHAKIIGKPDPPKKLKFNENINDDEMPYVSWEPGFNGGCDQTFILRFEKILIKTHSRRDTVRGKPMTIKKINFVEGHHEILDVESNNIFAITSPKEAKEILLHIEGHEPSSTYKIMLHSENVYGRSTELTLDANESTGFGLIPGHYI